MLGMALKNTKKTAERRVRGIYAKSSSRGGVKLTAIVIMAALAVGCFTTACQPVQLPVPEAQSPSSEQEEQAAVSAPTPTPTAQARISAQQYQVTGHMSDTVQNGKLTVDIDADILEPAAGEYPVVRVEPSVLTQPEVDRMVDYFAQGRPLYLPDIKTKAYWQRLLEDARNGQHADETYTYLQDNIEKAPETYARQYADSTITYYRYDDNGDIYEQSGKNFLNVRIETEDMVDPLIQLENRHESQDQTYVYTTDFRYGRVAFYEAEYDVRNHPGQIMEDPDIARTVIDSIRITPEEAQSAAEKLLGDLGITGLGLADAEKASFIALEHNPLSGYEDTAGGGYALRYVRGSGALDGYLPWGTLPMDGDDWPDYIPPYNPEEAIILVDNGGVAYFSWHAPVRVLDTVTPSADLLPMDQIQGKLTEWVDRKKQFYMKTVENTDNEVSAMTVLVDFAKLCVNNIEEPENPGSALLVPVWVFDITETRSLTRGATYTYHYYYCINALDGGTMPP